MEISILVWSAAVFVVADVMGVVGNLGQYSGELLERQIVVLIYICLSEEVLQVAWTVPFLQWGDRTCVSVPPSLGCTATGGN